jgi:hypothetical protein
MGIWRKGPNATKFMAMLKQTRGLPGPKTGTENACLKYQTLAYANFYVLF